MSTNTIRAKATSSAEIPVQEPEEALKLGTKLAGQTRTQYQIDPVLQHRAEPGRATQSDRERKVFCSKEKILRDALTGLAALQRQGVLLARCASLTMLRRIIFRIDTEGKNCCEATAFSVWEWAGTHRVGLVEHLDDDSAQWRDLVISVADEFTTDDPRKRISMWQDLDKSFRDINEKF
ncbi:hypothetical protein EMPG_16866 [Blastomyces silverae]|uniref:Uncharacterized protein n=1 Tax=Blastomyces silverae TaxID=2060906 RepID=A0A0H1B9G7_9EURO|nr:hypothetical protein EMPG_16866 [Blastomyces silverae]